MIVFVFLLFIFVNPAHAQEAVGDDTSGMRLTREAPAAEQKPTEYVPSVPDPVEQKTNAPPSPAAEAVIAPLDSPALYIDSSRLLKFTVLNKQTARTEALEVSEGGSVTYGTLNIRLIECWHSAPDTAPESAALLQIYENSSEPSYFGWMWASTPSLNPFEHASYDITVKECR